jgi:hypothetical protein
MEGKWCEAAQGPCNPRDCIREFCEYRQKWAINHLREWAYSTDYEKPVNPQKTDNNNTSKSSD